jgi:peptide/nickel transport system permease protein
MPGGEQMPPTNLDAAVAGPSTLHDDEKTSETSGSPPLREAQARGWRSLVRRFIRHRLAVIGLVLLVVLYGVAILAPLIVPYDPNRISLLNRLANPSLEHWLGTDETGRDVLSRLMMGSRVSLSIGLAATVVAIVVGSVVGSIAGFVGGVVDSFLMRIVDAMLTIPTFFLALLVLSVFGSSFLNLILVIGLTGWMTVARVVRSEVLRTKNEEFVLAAWAMGAAPAQTLVKHVFPQAIPSLIVAASLGVGEAIILESALSYLGLGIQPPSPTWGNMLAGSQSEIWTRPDLAIYPGLLILMSVMAFNFVGDALRDTLDPRQRGA